MDIKHPVEHPGTRFSPLAGSPGTPKRPIDLINSNIPNTPSTPSLRRSTRTNRSSLNNAQMSSQNSRNISDQNASSASNSNPTPDSQPQPRSLSTANPTNQPPAAPSSPPVGCQSSQPTVTIPPFTPDTIVLLKDLTTQTTRVIAIRPSPACQICPPIIANYHARKNQSNTLQEALIATCCTDRCNTAQDKLINYERLSAEESLIQFFETHLRIHPNCGSTRDIIRYRYVY